MSTSQVLLAHSFWVICPNAPHTFVELCTEMPYWRTILVHKYGCRKSTKTSGVRFFNKSSFSPLRTSTRAHKHIFWYLKWLYCWKPRGETVFQWESIPFLVSCTVKTRKFKLLYFQNETCYRNEKLYKDLFFGLFWQRCDLGGREGGVQIKN